jgi:anti-sigma-K factor RskA
VNDVHALTGAYAVDALDDIERAQFERHLVDCAECRAEVDSLRAGAAMLAELQPVTPSADLRSRILAEVATVRPLPPVVAEVRPVRRRFPTLVAAAAAVVMLGVGGGLVATQPWADDSTTSEINYASAERVLEAPDTERYVHRLSDGSKATIYRSKQLGQAVIVTEGMADPGEGNVYELWLQHDGEMVAAGFMPEGPDNTVLLSGDAATADGIGITVEPEGGSPEPNLDAAITVAFNA